ncbi:MAG TPA: dihydrodipicolinate synthase family protein [Acidimicrobiales bacterium]|jgi:dihydrodipicolinate synthase/N-acetylneuraminate lyase|nr:dihydrodipicolinate synthase family protein [Acidimicrobiales bacterium]
MTEPLTLPPQRPGRPILGMSAVLLPFHDDGSIAWDAFAAAVDRTATAGLVPAVNMDTGYGPSLDRATRRQVLDAAAAALGDRSPMSGWTFVAGAHLDDPGPPRPPALDLDDYRAAVAEVADAGGVPILFPSRSIADLPEGDVAPAHAVIARDLDRLLGFELGHQFHLHGRIWSLATYAEVLEIPQVVGAKHSSLERGPEWDRLALRDERRPDFLVLTGNDLAIDMVRWGSDYLLGLSAFAPEAFARRDRLWAAGDGRALVLDDALQALGAVAFRPPVPAYRHDAALVWQARGWAPSSRVHPDSPTRPDGEAALLATLLDRLDAVVAATDDAA